MAQGKAWEREKVVEVLEPLFKLGWNVPKACEFAGIPRTTFQTWLDNDEELRLKIGTWRGMVTVASTQNVARAIIKEQDVALSQWWLERTAKDQFGQKNGNGNGESRPIIVINAGQDPYLTAEGRKLLPDPIKVDVE